MSDLLVIGGGVIGLSIAYEAAGQGRTVRVIDSGAPAREASWAGAGMLPPARRRSRDAVEQLTALSNRLHAEWAEELRDTTGIDNGFRRCGAVYVADNDEQSESEIEALRRAAVDGEIDVTPLAPAELSRLEPALRPSRPLQAACHVPEECQIRNPRHLKALLAGCARRGVEIVAGAAAEAFDVRGDRVHAVRTARGSYTAGQFCLATGAWSSAIARQLGLELTVHPVRGQIALLSLPRPILSRNINQGKRYLVPRTDGRVLVGATEENAGFDRSTTAGAIGALLAFAQSLVPELADAQLERSWAGLRPATRDGVPYLGHAAELQNAFVAAGHFRSGLQLSTGTAVVMGQLMAGETPGVDLDVFRIDRAPHAAGAAGRIHAT